MIVRICSLNATHIHHIHDIDVNQCRSSNYGQIDCYTKRAKALNLLILEPSEIQEIKITLICFNCLSIKTFYYLIQQQIQSDDKLVLSIIDYISLLLIKMIRINLCFTPIYFHNYVIFLPGLRRKLGSNILFICRKIENISLPYIDGIYFTLASPSPCSPVIVPPLLITLLKIF